MDPGRDGELARQVSHDLAAWCAKPRHRAPRERRGAHAIKFESLYSSQDYTNVRVRTFRHHSKYAFASSILARFTKSLERRTVEKYEDISAKSYRAWAFMYHKYMNTSQSSAVSVDFVLKADMDTHIIWEEALRYLSRFDSALPHYIGRQLVDPRDGPFVAGTAVILSNEALRIFQETTRTGLGACSRKYFASHKQAEDVALAHCLKEVGIYPQNTRDASGAERFMVLNSHEMYSEGDPLPRWYMKRSLNTKKGSGCCSDEAIAFHYVSAAELAEKIPVFKDGEWSWASRDYH